MRVFVINLEKDAARRESVTRQLRALGLAYELVAGVHGAALSADERTRHYDDRKAKWRLARSLVPAEIGCALSHLAVYRRIVASGVACALVLEDDVVLPADLASFLSDCESALHASRPQIALLSPARGRDDGCARTLPRSGRALAPFVSGVFASSYVVTAAAARALLAELYPVGDVADCWNRPRRYGVVELFVALPPLTKQDRAAFGSSTASDYWRHVRNDGWTWLAYKARRTRSVLWDFVYAPYRRATRRRFDPRIGS